MPNLKQACLAGFLLFLNFIPNGWACSVCFGDPNSLQTKSIVTGIIVLLSLTGVVLAAIAYTAFVWIRRAKSSAKQF